MTRRKAAPSASWRQRILSALRNEYFWLAIIVLAGAFARLYRFGSVPPGLNQDEGSLAYDAFSLLRYGMERNGHTWPIMLEAYGSSMSGTLAAYLSMPFIAVGGLTVTAARSLNAVLGIVTIGVFWAIGREAWDRRTGLLAAFFMAINPWNIMASRWGLDCNLFPPLFSIGVLALLTLRNRPWGLSLTAGIFGLCLYSYGIALVAVPLFLAIMFFVLVALGERRWRRWLAAGACFAVVAAPMATYLVINERELPTLHMGAITVPNLSTTPRYREGSTVFSAEALHNALKNVRLFSGILWRQSDGWIHNALPPYGILYSLGLPLALIGVGVTLWQGLYRRHLGALTLLAWLAAAGAVVAAVDPNINRVNIAFPPLILCCGLAVASCKVRWLRTAAIALFAVFFAGFVHAYFTSFPGRIAGSFHAGLPEASAAAAGLTTGKICVTAVANMPEISVLFGTQTPPEVFATTVEYVDPAAHYRQTARFGRFTFDLGRCAAETGPFTFVAHASEVPALIARGMRLRERFGNFAVLTPPEASAP